MSVDLVRCSGRSIPANQRRSSFQQGTSFNHLQVKEKEKLKNIKQKRNFDKRRKVIQYIPLIRGDVVWIKDLKAKGRVVGKAQYPRSYYIQTSNGTYRRNRRHLTQMYSEIDTPNDLLNSSTQTVKDTSNVKKLESNRETSDSTPKQSSSKGIVTRFGRVSRKPDRLSY